jgi:hypothetical protein
MTQKHTALPWHIAKTKGKANRTLMSEDGVAIARVTPCRDLEGQHHAKANADLIVRAVNSHYELLAALKDATRIVEQCGQWQDTNETTTQIFKEEIEKFEAAIAKAEAAE